MTTPTVAAAEPAQGARTTLPEALAAWAGSQPERLEVADTVRRLAMAGVELAAEVARGALAHPASPASDAAGRNPSGDAQQPLDLAAEALFVRALRDGAVAGVCSEESSRPIELNPGGTQVVALDPLDGSSNIDINAPVGTIFSVLPLSQPAADLHAACLQPGRRQLAAGLVVFGPAIVVVLTVGDGTDVYVWDADAGELVRTRRGLQLPADSQEFAINASNARHWSPGIQTYVGDLVSGSLGPRERDFNMRWLAALVAETYRILLRGGIYLYPADARPGYEEGRLRLVYEANPVALLCEQAGGAATDGIVAILDVQPTSLHQHTPLVFGSSSKVERVKRYLTDPQTEHEQSPLFSSRGLFRT
jgi:fructose-1,6-bisphosphatase I